MLAPITRDVRDDIDRMITYAVRRAYPDVDDAARTQIEIAYAMRQYGRYAAATDHFGNHPMCRAMLEFAVARATPIGDEIDRLQMLSIENQSSVNIITLAAGRHVLTDAQALHLVGDIRSFYGDAKLPTMCELSIDGETRHFPIVPGLATAETDIMYGRLVNTPAGLVRVDGFMAIMPFDYEKCLTSHPRGAFWGVLDLDVDTELTWGPGWYQLAGQDRVDLMLPQLTELAFGYGKDDLVEPLTHDEIVATGFHIHRFQESTTRYHGDIEPLIKSLQRGGHESVVAKLERLRDAGAEEVFERLVFPDVGEARPHQVMPEPRLFGMVCGQASMRAMAG